MRLILSSRSGKNGLRSDLLSIHKAAIEQTEHVQAAIAYASSIDHPVVKDCNSRRIRCQIWSRHDHTLATALPVLEWAFNLPRTNGNFTWKVLGPFYHPKVIWWHGYGVYLGSANLTDSAWFSNCEAGTFISEADLDESGLRAPLEDFFVDIEDQSRPITAELLADARALLADESEIDAIRRRMKQRLQQSAYSQPFTQESLASVNRAPARDRRKIAFLREWNETLSYLGTVQARLAELGNRPVWVPEDASPGIHTDQFLHAFYYTQVREGNSHPVEKWHAENRANPEAALLAAIRWWRATIEAPDQEDTVFNVWAPLHRELLTPDRLERMTSDEFAHVVSCVHAIRNHAKYKEFEDMPDPADFHESKVDAKSLAFGRLIYFRTNALGWRPPQLLRHLLFGGPAADAPLRLFDCLESPQKLSGLDLSSLGELIGWGLPEVFPPRNDRTNKALRALGWDVRVRSPNQE